MRQLISIGRFAVCIVFTCWAISFTGCGDGKSQPATNAQAKSDAAGSASMPLIAQDIAVANEPESREGYDAIEENNFFDTISQPQSTFSIDVDTASYSNVRRLIRNGTRPPKGAIRLEELINYFPDEYQEPTDESPFSVTTEIAQCPWKSDHQLMRVALRGRSLDLSDRKPCNLVFLIDVSGSMNSPDKLPLVQSALRMLVSELKPEDRIAIVVYAGGSGLVLDSTSASDAKTIVSAIDRLSAGGSTNGGAGIQLAYQVAQTNRIDGGVNRVLLCTDGDFNVGVSSDSALVDLIQEEAKKNVFLSVLGFGHGNVRDSTMEKLADKGNGNYAFIDSMLEARKVLVDQIGGTLVTIAKDVKIQLDFNPKHISAYRLLGYENRKLDNQDFRDDRKDAGEVGAGHTVTAFYELVPAGVTPPNNVGRESEFVERKSNAAADSPTMLTVNLRYKQPDEEDSKEFQLRVDKTEVAATASSDFRFAASVLAYGMLLRDSSYAGDASWDWVISTAKDNLGKDSNGLRAEFLQLAMTASQLTKQ
jgi:Ca-activated chloride channel family protein